MTASTALPLMIGARTVARLRRRLVCRPLTLAETLSGDPPRLPPLPADADGYLVNSLPAPLVEALCRQSGLRPFIRQRYRRSYASLELDFDAYLDTFSAKSRSTLKRKVRKFAGCSGGRIDLRCYRTAVEMEDFQAVAGQVSARTYQERLLGAGLPQGEEALSAMRALAARDSIRAWVLFLAGQPIAYLHAPADGDTLIYAHLGYDPDFAAHSPGTVLQAEAMRQLTEERRFRWFDFTEGEGQHKRQFATGSVECVDLLLVKRNPINLLVGWTLNGFDAAVAIAKRAVVAAKLERLARAFRR